MKKILAHLILLNFEGVSLPERMNYFFVTLVKIAPVAYLLSLVKWWFSENEQFGVFMCIALFLNTLVGAVFHFVNGTFSYPQFFKRNTLMVFVVVVTYVMLELLRYTAGDNIVGEIFKVTIQIATLLYPGSKIFKNCYLLSSGKFPPEFIMAKLYSFEKNGDLNDFFKLKNKDDNGAID